MKEKGKSRPLRGMFCPSLGNARARSCVSLAPLQNKVVVAISGGVDSSVAAALLKRAGFDVVGVFMRFWKAPSSKTGAGWNRCCSQEAEKRARTVAQKLGIPFYTLNFAKEFKKRIVDYFLEEYKQGRTPNPCVICNKEIKFGLLLEKALVFKADFIATGHYARIKSQIHPKPAPLVLWRASDKEKDQSYFLWQLTQKQLRRTLFPIGDYTKREVRQTAKKLGLPVAEIKESQEVCFIEKTTEEFLRRYLKERPGKIVTEEGQMLGEHQGLWFYTIGQRKGIGLSGGPYYVLEKDLRANALIVTKDEKKLERKELLAERVNWVSGKPPKLPLKVQAKIRYNSPLAVAIVQEKLSRGRLRVVFSKPQRAVTPGQSVVFYSLAEASTKAGRGQELLGGGVICYNK